MSGYKSGQSKYSSGAGRSLASLAKAASSSGGITSKVGQDKDNSAAKASASASAGASDFIRQHAEMMKKKREAEKAAKAKQ